MKKHFALIVFVFTGLVGTVVQADTLQIERHSDLTELNWVDFRFEAVQGVAWLNVHLNEYVGHIPGMQGSPFRPSTHIAWVPGLLFDSAASQITFSGSVGKIVCATVTEVPTHHGTMALINPTGACRTYSTRENHATVIYFEAN